MRKTSFDSLTGEYGHKAKTLVNFVPANINDHVIPRVSCNRGVYAYQNFLKPKNWELLLPDLAGVVEGQRLFLNSSYDYQRKGSCRKKSQRLYHI